MTGRPAPSDVEGRHGPFGPLWGYVTVTQRERTWLDRVFGASYSIGVEWNGSSESLEDHLSRDAVLNWLERIVAEFDAGRPPDLNEIGISIAADRAW